MFWFSISSYLSTHLEDRKCKLTELSPEHVLVCKTCLTDTVWKGRQLPAGPQAGDQEPTILLFRKREAYRQTLHVPNAKSASRCARHFDHACM